jgi:hypothetical protein
VKSPIVIYLGPSMLDGAPIVVLASVGSSNVKTGPMVQTWIMRADLPPVKASHASEDSSVCGMCPRRHSLGGDCYVQVFHAPRSVWDSWDRAGQPGENWSDPGVIMPLAQDALTHGLRLGSYGDPMAVPHEVWHDLIAALQPRKVVGYTHQWRSAVGPMATTLDATAWFRGHVMASCDTVGEASEARANGWRYFLAVQPGATIPERTIQCPATRDVNPLTCDQCGACDGARTGSGKASIYLWEHGVRSVAKGKRSAALAVMA